jgi:hypothetical protein
MTLTQEKMNALLDQFTKAVDAKKYKRIPYPDWKKLKSAGKCRAVLIVDSITGQTTIAIRRASDSKVLIEFDAADKSFGEFLLTQIMNEGEVKVMPPKSSNDDFNYYYSTDTASSKNSYYGTTSTELSYSGSSYSDNSITFNDFNRVYNGNTGTSLSGTFVTKDELDTALAKKADKVSKTEENKMKSFNFDFGPCSNNAVKMSLYGLAVKNSTGTWVSYDPKTESIVDVDILNFDGAKYLYKIPTAIKDIKAGDVVVHAGKPMFVTSIGSNSKSLYVVDPISGEKKEVMLTRSPFGFDFATKIVNFLGNFMDSTASADSPFGNMWMLMLASGENNGLADLAPLMLMNGNSGNMNPMMMYFMLSNGNKDNLLPLMFMMNSTNTTPATHTCACGGNCGKADTNA